MNPVRLRVFSGVLTALLITSCSLFSGDSESLKPLPLPQLEELVVGHLQWSVRLPQQVKFNDLQPVLANDLILSPSHFAVSAIDIKNGELIWQYVHDTPLTGGIGVYGSRALVSDENGVLLLLDVENGDLLNYFSLMGLNRSAPSLDDSLIVLNLSGGLVQALIMDSEGIADYWQYSIKPPLVTLRGNSSPLLYRNLVIAGLDDGQLVALDRNSGILRWRYRLGRQKGRDIDSLVDVDSRLQRRDNWIYAVSFNGRIAKLNALTGRAYWDHPFSSVHGPAVSDQTVVAIDYEDRIVAFDTETGQQLWQNAELLRRQLSAPQIVGDYVVSCDSEGYCHLLNLHDGTPVGRFAAAGTPQATVATDDGLLMVLNGRGVLSAWHLNTLH